MASPEPDARSARESWISGTILLPTEAPLANAGARIHFVGQYGGFPRSVRTEADGTYTASPYRPGTYEVVLKVPGYAAVERNGVQLEPGEQLANIDFVLDAPASTIAGVVYQLDGTTPEEGADVWVAIVSPPRWWPSGNRPAMGSANGRKPTLHPGRPPAHAVSGPGGTFEITDVPEGTYRVYAHAPGYMVSPADDEITVGRSEAGAGTRVMLRLGGTVRGIVYGADGEPLAKAQLSGDQKARYPHVIAHSSLRITTDEQGRYAAENLLPGRYEWELEGDDGARAEAVVELHEAELIAGLDFRFTLGSALTVAVTKPDGAADGEAQVQLYRENDTPYPAREGRAQAVDAQGRVRFEHLLDGAYWVTVSSPHGAARRAGPWTVAAGEPPPEMDVRLEEGATIRGRVVDERGEPVPEVSVTGYRSTYDGAGPSMLSATRTTVTTDGDGRFVIPHAAAGRWRLRAEGTSHAEADASAEVADRGESAVHIAVHRTWSGTLGGRILGPDGIPAAETRVSLQLLASPAGREVGVEHVRTDGEGRFSVAVDEKIGRVKVFPAGLSPAAVEVLPSDTAMASLEVRLPPVSGMAGTVEADGGIIPPGGLFVLAGPPDGSVPLPEDPDDPWPPVGTGFARVMPGQSDWEILGLAPGTYEVFTYAPGLSASVPSPVMVAEGDIALAVVEAALPGGAITGRVLTADGAPLGGVDIHVTTSGGRLRSSSSRVKSDEQGRYRLEGLTPGAVTLRLHSVENRGFARPPDHTTLVMPGVTTENVDFTLLAGGE